MWSLYALCLTNLQGFLIYMDNFYRLVLITLYCRMSFIKYDIDFCMILIIYGALVYILWTYTDQKNWSIVYFCKIITS